MNSKRILMLGLCLSLFFTVQVAAQYSPSASTEVYDFSAFGEKNLLNLFYDALKNGRQYPTQAEFEAAGFDMSDVEFARSHVRPATLIDDQSAQLNKSIKNTRRFWMNTPMGAARTTGGYPNTNTGDDTYSMWNYTHLFGSWNHGLFQAPGCWIDAAHQNGTDILSGTKFFESWTSGSGDEEYSALITQKNSDGTFKYVEPLINILLYFGSDGINYNWEDDSYDDAAVVAFHKALYAKAAEKGFKNFHIGLYTSNKMLHSNNVNALFGNSKGRTAETFLNYMDGDFTSEISASLSAARNAMGTTDGLYAGAWIVSMNRTWTRFSGNDMGMVLWGEHANSRFWSNNTGNDASSFQANLQALYERAFSGGRRNPANRPTMSNTGNSWTWNGSTPPLSTFGGIATYFPERSAIQGTLPFHSYFNIGTGEVYNYKGKKTTGTWYNMSTQDIVPTYRWLVYSAGTTTVSTAIQPEFTIDDAYMGGSCLRLRGSATTKGTDIVLFHTRLKGTSGSPYAKLAVKTGAEAETETLLYLIVKVGGTWQEYPVGTTTSKQWEEKTIPLDGISAGDQIDYIGLRVRGSRTDYNLLVGKLELNDNITAVPADVRDLKVDVRGETTSKLSAKLHWQVDASTGSRSEYGLIYNDEANIDHFEVLYKNGENGRVSVVGHVKSWATLVGDLPMSADERPFIGVRTVSTDLKTYGAPVWVEVMRSTNVPDDYQGEGPSYGSSTINTSADGYLTAITRRYLTKVTTTGASIANLDYQGHACSDESNYILASDNVLKVKQGDLITLNYTYYSNSDGLQYCTQKSYADWNCNGYFEGATDELLVEQGNADTGNASLLKPFQFQVPTDAVCGRSRLRMVFSDAWLAHPGPTGLTSKGFTIDFPIEITGDNPERTVVNTRDEGLSEEPEDLFRLGDVNTDGSVTIADVTALVNILLGEDDAEPHVYDHVAADVNGDGSITIADVTELVNIILSKPN